MNLQTKTHKLLHTLILNMDEKKSYSRKQLHELIRQNFLITYSQMHSVIFNGIRLEIIKRRKHKHWENWYAYRLTDKGIELSKIKDLFKFIKGVEK